MAIPGPELRAGGSDAKQDRPLIILKPTPSLPWANI
jgi:hypothetical protein